MCQLGGSKLASARKQAAKVLKDTADFRAANVIPVIREVRKAGAVTLRDIADALNARGISTARGGQWHATSVKNVLTAARISHPSSLM
jgi:Recombinase